MNNQRYIRQITLPQVGESGQQKLGEASVLVIGAGGLGNALLPYLVSSGIGRVGIIDGDMVSESNLHRQVLFSREDVGKSKVEVVKNKLQVIDPSTSIETYEEYLAAENALELFKRYDIIVDATDRVPVRYLINDAAVLTGKPFVHAALYRFQVQMSTFNFNNGPTYRCLYPTAPRTTQSCAEAGVMPTTVALAGMLQANEVMKVILEIGDVSSGKLLLWDTLSNQQHQFTFQSKEQHISEELFYQRYRSDAAEMISLKEAQQRKGWFVDVRETHEVPKLSMENYVQFPLSTFEEKVFPIEKGQNIYLFCQGGVRSATAFKLLKEKEYNTIFCLEENAPELSKQFSHEEKKERIH